MYHPASLYYSSVPSCIDNNCIDFGIYGIEQNDCCIDLNCIEPSLIPEEQQAYTYAIATYYNNNNNSNNNNGITTSNSINDTITDNTEPVTSRTTRRVIRKKRAKKDPNEPQKPVSAYALFFRDTQAVIKGRSPNASFGEISKIVASMWDSLDCHAKNNETIQSVSVPEKRGHVSTETMNTASSSSLKQEASTTVGEMTLANLIARPPSTNFSSLYLHQRTVSDVNKHQTLLLHQQHSNSGFDSVPLIIELIGIVTTVITCLLMHFIMKESYEDIDRPTTHHLIHHKYYSKQLNQLLNEQDRRKKRVRDDLF
ncbi:HMG box [Onchocerca flexuosa]|uniref:HMG box n=1 Tax=Onchocerca flexuosa TaxID=387005 RepID=A0A238BVP0_9BILA|nr:HMG box [Onchocerca flexuosa]